MEQSDKPQIGGWFCVCCIHDLQQIKTQDDVEAAEDEDFHPRYWPTLDAALEALEPECWGDDWDMGMIWAFSRFCDYKPKRGVLHKHPDSAEPSHADKT